MLTSKQRSYLSGLAADAPDIVFIGKEGVNRNVIKQTLDNLKARELIKCKVQQNCLTPVRDVADSLAQETKSEVVRVIGRKFILYKKNLQKKENIIPSKSQTKRKPGRRIAKNKKKRGGPAPKTPRYITKSGGGGGPKRKKV